MYFKYFYILLRSNPFYLVLIQILTKHTYREFSSIIPEMVLYKVNLRFEPLSVINQKPFEIIEEIYCSFILIKY